MPNITGKVTLVNGGTSVSSSTGGAFQRQGSGSQIDAAVKSGNNGFYFDASRCSAVYGSSETVTPLSESVIMCIKH